MNEMYFSCTFSFCIFCDIYFIFAVLNKLLKLTLINTRNVCCFSLYVLRTSQKFVLFSLLVYLLFLSKFISQANKSLRLSNTRHVRDQSRFRSRSRSPGLGPKNENKPGPDQDSDWNKNVQLFNTQNSITFQRKCFVHPKSNYYFHINFW